MDVGEDVGVIQAWQDMTKEHEGVAEGGAEEGLVRLRLKELLVNHNKQKANLNTVKRLLTFTCDKIDDQAWPPVKVTNFINLALVRDNTSWRRTVQESVDEIIGEKQSIVYQQVFSNLDKLKFILFEGRPGSGKTTLMTKISQDWANGLVLESKLLFLIPLRRLNRFRERNLATLIQVACPPFRDDEIESLERAVQTINGNNVIFIFDGFDEYSPVANDIVLSLMDNYRNLLRDALIVVSSRPAACQAYRWHADKQIEVVGFLKDHITQYIHHYYSNDVGKAQQLLGHLAQYPNLMNMCYLPLHCAMLVFLYDGTAILPKTETEFYEHFTISTLLRSFRKSSGSVACLTSFDQLPPKDKSTFYNVCKLAFTATVARKQVFNLSEIQEISLESGSIGSGENYLGLVVVDRCFMRYGLDETYTFLHLTFQEYLAAVYLSGFGLFEPRSITGYDLSHVVCKFLCGMLNFRLPGSMVVFNTIRRSQSTLATIQCVYESQSNLLYDYIIREWKGTFRLEDKWVMSDGPAIASFLNNKKIYHVTFSFGDSDLNKDEVDAVLNYVDNKDLTVNMPLPSYRSFEGTCQQMIAERCETRVGSLSFHIILHEVETTISYKLARSHLKLPNFHFVMGDSGGRKVGDDAVQYLRECSDNEEKLRPLKVFDDVVITGLRYFSIYPRVVNLKIHIPGAHILAPHFRPEDYATCLSDLVRQRASDIQEIRTFDLKISESSVLLELINTFKYCTKLSYLDLGAVQLNISAVQALGQCLKNMCWSIKVLMVDENHIGDTGLRALMPGIESCVCLQQLILHHNELTDTSVPLLIKLVLTNKNLRRLGCLKNHITEVGRSKLKAAMLETDGLVTDMDWIKP